MTNVTLHTKLVLTGGCGVGRTSLLLTYTNGKFPSKNIVGVYIKSVKTHVDGRPVEAYFLDLSGGVSSCSKLYHYGNRFNGKNGPSQKNPPITGKPTGLRLNIKSVFPRYGDSLLKIKTVVRQSYL